MKDAFATVEPEFTQGDDDGARLKNSHLGKMMSMARGINTTGIETALIEPKPIEAPQDCINDENLRRFIDQVRYQISRSNQQASITIELSKIARMNTNLLAVLLLLIRETVRAGRSLRFIGATSQFITCARIYRVLAPFERCGVLLP